MEYTITRWPGPEPASEQAVKQTVQESGLTAMCWTGEPDKLYPPHHHVLTKTLWCAAGEIVFQVNGQAVHLTAGDKMVLPDGTVHSAKAGPDGVVCYEAPPVHENITIHEHA